MKVAQKCLAAKKIKGASTLHLTTQATDIGSDFGLNRTPLIRASEMKSAECLHIPVRQKNLSDFKHFC